jgi:hypothetical protein
LGHSASAYARSSFVRLPGGRAFPPKLERLGQALEQCYRSREVEPTVKAAKTQVDVLRDGFEAVGRFESDLSDAAIESLVTASAIVNEQVSQLEASSRGTPCSRANALNETRPPTVVNRASVRPIRKRRTSGRRTLRPNRCSSQSRAGLPPALLRRTLQVRSVSVGLVIRSAQEMDTPRDYSSHPRAILRHIVTRGGERMKRTRGSMR